MRHGYLLSALLLVAATSHAGVVINGTRRSIRATKGVVLWVFQTQMPRIIWYSPGLILAVKTRLKPPS